MKVSTANICLSCDTIFEGTECTECCDRFFKPLKCWIEPLFVFEDMKEVSRAYKKKNKNLNIVNSIALSLGVSTITKQWDITPKISNKTAVGNGYKKESSKSKTNQSDNQSREQLEFKDCVERGCSWAYASYAKICTLLREYSPKGSLLSSEEYPNRMQNTKTPSKKI